MLKVGLNRHFHRRWYVATRALVLLAGLFLAIGAFAQPTINSDPVAQGADTGTYGASYNYDITTDTWPRPVDITLNSGAPGLTLTDNHDGTATLSGTPSAAGVFNIIIEVNDPFDSQASTQNFDLTINKAVLTAKADNQTRFYGYPDPTFTISYTGFKFSDNASVIDSPPVATPTSNDNSVPGGYTINVVTTSALDDNYTFTPATGTLSITPAPLTITAANKTKVYGDVNPTLTLNYTGFQNGETSTALLSQPSVSVGSVDETTSVGSYTITVTGGTSTNYSISRVNGSLSITKASLLVKADNQTRAYGDANPTLTITYQTFLNGDTPAVLDTPPTISTTAGNTTGVGGVAITVSGGNDNNYDFTYQNGTLTISKAPLTLTADNHSRPYFTVNPTLTITYTGLKNSETSAVFTTQPGISTTGTQSSNAGTYPITVSGGAAANYSFNTYNAGTLTITKIALTAKADDQLRVYGSNNPTFTITYTGFVNSETAAVIQTPPTASSTATSASGVGTYPITVNVAGATDENYTFTPSSGTLTVAKATLTVTADNQSKAYGAALPALTFDYTGFVGSDNAAGIDTPPTISTTGTVSSNVGTYPITLSGGLDNNYSLSLVAGTLTVTKASLTVTADNQSKVYGAVLPTLTFTYSGFIGSDNAAGIDTPPTISTTGTVSSNVGTYPITLTGGLDNNYALSLVAGTLTVTKATLTVTADNQSKVYGAALPTLTFTYSGFIGSDNAAGIDTPPTISTTGTVSSNVGTYPITLSGGLDNNYALSLVAGTLTVTKASLTVTADNQSKVYGAALPTLTFTYSGFIGSDNAAGIDTPPTISTTGTVSSNVGTYPITLSGGLDNNYALSLVAGTLTVTKATLTVTADNQSKVYGAALPTLTFTYSGFIGSDNAAGIDTPPTISTTGTVSSNVGTYPITLSGGLDNNYALSLVAGTLTVTKASLTVTADNQSKVYGAALPTLTFTYTGFIGSDNAAGIDTPPTISTTGTVSSNVGTYPITLSGGLDNNYALSLVAGTLTVTKATLTVTADNQSKVYGAALPTLTFTYSGFIGSDNAAGIDTPPTISTTGTVSSNVGTYPITLSGGLDNNYALSLVAGTLTVTKATLTVTADNQSKVYGAALPTLTFTYSGFIGSDNAAGIDTPPTISTTGTVSSNVGTYPITLSGGLDNNYALSLVAGTLTVTKASLTVTADNQSKIYGAALPTLTFSYSGFIGSDNAAGIDTPPTISTTGTVSSNVGTYPITLSGGLDNNYVLSLVAGTLTVTKATLTVTADNQSKVYGAALPTLTFTYSGFIGSDNAAGIDTPPTISTTGTVSSNVGTYPITLSGGLDNNYSLSLVAGTLTVTKASLTVTADNQSKVYGAALPTLTFTYSGFIGSDNAAGIDTPPTISTTGTVSSNVGTYPITLSGGLDNNYSLSLVAGTLTVTKASLAVHADAKTKVYGAANPALTFTYTGFIGSDNATGIDTPPTASTTATVASHVGSYPITLSGGLDNNYDLVLTGSTLTVTKAPLTITANDQSKTYGSPNPTLTVSYTGFANGDTQSVLTPPVTITTSALASSPVGTYSIVPSAAAADDYSITFVNGTLTINKATLTATADDKSRTYGAANPSFTITYTGFVNGDNVASIVQGTAASSANATSVVGTYPIVPSGGSATNYSFNYVNGTLTVTKATITATAVDASRTYGAADPTFTINYSGFLNGQNSSVFTTAPTASTTATVASDVGTYPITVSGGTAQNYAFTYVAGTLTINKATLTATADNKTRSYGATNPTFTITYTGFKNSQDASVINSAPAASTTATVTSNAGTYPITVAGGSDDNYTFTYVAGTLTIDKAVILATADNKSRVYGAANPAFTVTYTGLLNGNVASDIAAAPSMATSAVATSVVGTYPITISGGSDENYTFTYANGTLTVGKATITARPDDKTRTYGAANPAFTITYTGLANGETASVIDVPAMATTTAGATSNVGTYPITASGASDNNYDFTYTAGVLTVNKATLTLTANNQSRAYGAANPTLTIAYSGFLNGDTPAVLDAVAPSASTTATLTSAVGTYPISISNGTDNNYTYTLVAGTLTITKAVLTVTADDKTRVYNTANPTFTLSYSGFLNGDNVASITQPTATTSATITSPVGDYTISVSGGSATNYSFNPVSGTLTITKATPVVTWVAPSPITYGTALSATQLNATANVGGNFDYTPASGTILNAGANQTLSVNFTPADLTNYLPVNNTTVTITVNKATPVITWANPAPITYGTTLNTTNHLNATSNVPGSFTYTPVAGTLLNAGANQTLKADFHPTDAANYNDVLNIQRQITVNKATPTVTWNNPSPITYGTPLSLGVQLNATFSVPGTPTYVPGPGTILPTGANQVISVNFTPTDAANYNSVNNTQVLITVLKATPVITWSNPADITYGTALSGTQLNATSSVPGTFVYTPNAGTILPAGAGQTLSTSFTPTDATNYNSVPTTTVTINVGKANPVITWASPSPITYGTALSATQLNPTSNVPGSFTFNPVSGTILNAGANQTLSSTFTPTDQANYNTIVTNRTITVNKATPVVTWNSPSPIVYGTPLTSTQQNATANVPGTFDYTPVAGTILNTGVNQSISVKFTPNDQVNYNIVPTTTTTITVIKATPVVTWGTPLPIKVGVALSATQLNATANVPGTRVYTPAAGTSFGVEGTYTLHVQFTPTDQTNYNDVPDTQVQIVVSSKDNPVITWSDPAAITYGTALTTGVGGQLNASASVAGTYAYTPDAGTKLNAGSAQTLTVTFTPTDLVNYNIVSKNVSINVNKATLTATAASASRAYGNSNPSFVINYSGFVNGDAAGVIDTPPTATCAATPTSVAGSTFPIIPAGGSDNNYSFSYVNGTLTVNKAPLLATADNKTRTYGISNPPFTISYSGFANGDTEANITQPTASTTATITSNVGNYAISLTGGSASNYTITTQAGTLSISKALLVVIGNDLSRAYGQSNPTLTFRYIGFKNGDTETSISTPPTASTTATPASNVGSYPITVIGGSATNYSLQNFDGTLTITKATLTVKADDKTRTYGQANPSNTLTYIGFANGDDATDITSPTISGPAATALSDAGTYPIQLSGGAASNYDLSLQNGTLTVNKAALTAKPDNKSRQYGVANPTFTISYTGFVNGDDAGDITPPTASTTASITSDVNSYSITLTGGAATNYAFTLQTGTLTITAAPLTAKANDRTRTYGQGPGTLGITYTGFLNGDDASDITPPTASTTATAASNVGTYPITLSGGTATNYTLTLQSGTLTIAKAVLVVRADDKTRPYGSANPANTLTYEGFVNGDDATHITPPATFTPPTIGGPAVTATATSAVGTYPITLSGGFATNYTLDPQNGTLTITKVTLVAKADNKSRVYGAANPTFTITYTGFVNGENASVITPALSATTTATASTNVGSYAITIAPGTNTNYAFTYQDGTLTINKKPITVTAENKSRTYGNPNPSFTLTYADMANNETASVIDVPPTITVAADLTTPVSASPVVIALSGGSDNNYDMTLVNGSLAITKAPLTATADNKTRTYGAVNPATTITYTGFKNGQTASSLTTQPTAVTSATISSDVGNYPIVVSGGSSVNYDITPVNGTLTVTRAVLTVAANNQSRSYGSPNPALTLNYTGFVNSQNISVIDTQPTAATTAGVTSNAGTYNITVSGGVDNNYSFSYTSGVLTVDKATLTATADATTTTYGTIPALTITYAGFVNNETVSVLDTEPTASTTATVTSNIGSYPINVTGGTDNNYAFTNVAGTLTINKAPLDVTADDKSRVISLPNPALTISYSGFKNNETEDVIDTKPSTTTTANLSSPPGTYPITVTGGIDDHYELIYHNGTLTVILDNAPVAKNFQVETDEDVQFNFGLALFENNRTDDPNGKIFYVKVVTLPQNGILFRGSTRVVAGDEIQVDEDELSEPLVYQPNSNYSGDDAFNWNLFDGSFLSANNATITIKIAPVNDAPVLSNIEPSSLSYSLGDAAIPVSESLIINDVDDNFIFSASILIASNFTDGDQLSVAGGLGDANIEASYDPFGGELTLTGKESRSVYQSILTKVTFSSPVSGDATISEKDVTFIVRDSTADSNVASRKIEITEVFPELDIVNSFTPNGDDVNDYWDILNLESYTSINIFVFNQDGGKVFECHEPNCLWDGTNKGTPLPAGPYMYTIDVNNGKRKYKGTVNILK